MVQPGRYRHYKGHEYEVLGVARHSETEEEYVVYRALYGDWPYEGKTAVALADTDATSVIAAAAASARHVSPAVAAFIRSRRDVQEPPGEEIADFEHVGDAREVG